MEPKGGLHQVSDSVYDNNAQDKIILLWTVALFKD